MRRSAMAILGTIAGTALLIGAKSSTSIATTSPAVPDAAAIAALDATPDNRASGHQVSRASRAAPATPPGTTGPGRGLTDGTFTQTSAYLHGSIQVTIKVSSGQLTDVSAACTCTGTAAGISNKAFTKLRQEALEAQSASIATVSGATYTSDAYRSSLQATLNAAHA